MKLLFTTTDPEKASDEIKLLLGYIDADIKFINILPDIITATNELIKLVGNNVYNHIYDIYETDVDENDLEDIDAYTVRSLKYPILVKAYSLFAPSNDLSHTNEGRKMRNDEHQKTPWQWQLDEDNKSQEKRYYRALDDLIKLLDDSKPENYSELEEIAQASTLYHKWITSASYKDSKALFVNTVDDFNKVFQIESSLLLLKLSSGLSTCEKREILPRIGKTKFDLLKTLPITNEIDIKLMELIHEACVFYSLAWAIPIMSITIFPEGILQYQITGRVSTIAKTPALALEKEYARLAFKNSADLALLDIEKLLTPIPEIPTNPIINPIIPYIEKGFTT